MISPLRIREAQDGMRFMAGQLIASAPGEHGDARSVRAPELEGAK